MGYVFSEIWPLLLLALVIGFLLGWLALWCRRRMLDGAAASEHSADLARRDEDLGLYQARVAQLEGSVGELDSARARIAELEPQAALVAGLQAKVSDLGANSGELAQARERLEKLEGEHAWQRQAHSAALEEATAETTSLRARIAELEAERTAAPAAALVSAGSPGDAATIRGLRARIAELESPTEQKPLDLGAAKEVLGRAIRLDDLTVVEGIGPKIAGLCNEIGVRTWQGLAGTAPERLQQMLDDAGPRYRVHSPTTWPQQARLLAGGQWEEFRALCEQLTAGRE